jgi:hypothetical protein
MGDGEIRNPDDGWAEQGRGIAFCTPWRGSHLGVAELPGFARRAVRRGRGLPSVDRGSRKQKSSSFAFWRRVHGEAKAGGAGFRLEAVGFRLWAVSCGLWRSEERERNGCLLLKPPVSSPISVV